MLDGMTNHINVTDADAGLDLVVGEAAEGHEDFRPAARQRRPHLQRLLRLHQQPVLLCERVQVRVLEHREQMSRRAGINLIEETESFIIRRTWHSFMIRTGIPKFSSKLKWLGHEYIYWVSKKRLSLVSQQ